MDLTNLYKNLENVKKCKDNFGCTYFSSEDYAVCNFVINNTLSYSFSPSLEKRISKHKLIKESLKTFHSFDQDNYFQLLKIVFFTKFIKDYQEHHGGVDFSFSATATDNKKNISDGYITAYHIPKTIYEIDIVMLGHEYCHSLKETNVLEYKNNLLFGEVIPIFYELIDYENDFLRQNHLQFRLFWLTREKEIYEMISRNTNIYHYLSKEYDMNKKRNIHAFTKSYFGSYLTGFYYAIILYSMYKKEPDKILGLVSKVLKHDLTTFDMLKILNIYCDIKGDIYQKEFKGMVKILTK